MNARQARFRIELKRLTRRGVPAAKAMKQAWKRVPKNPRTASPRYRRVIAYSLDFRGKRSRGMPVRGPALRPSRRRKTDHLNPPTGGVLIYDKIKAIEAVKGATSNYPGQLFRHDFTRNAKVFGMPDGSLRVVPSGRSTR